MKYLVDVNVLSETTKSSPLPSVVAWLESHISELVIDSVVLGEIAIGILTLPRGRKRAHLERWFEKVVERIHCLDWTAAVSRRWSRLVADLRQQGQSMPILDSMIAATALTHGLIVATRDSRDFQKSGVRIVNPFV